MFSKSFVDGINENFRAWTHLFGLKQNSGVATFDRHLQTWRDSDDAKTMVTTAYGIIRTGEMVGTGGSNDSDKGIKRKYTKRPKTESAGSDSVSPPAPPKPKTQSQLVAMAAAAATYAGSGGGGNGVDGASAPPAAASNASSAPRSLASLRDELKSVQEQKTTTKQNANRLFQTYRELTEEFARAGLLEVFGTDRARLFWSDDSKQTPALSHSKRLCQTVAIQRLNSLSRVLYRVYQRSFTTRRDYINR